MGSSSITGTGPGSSKKKTLDVLSILANGPTIIFTGFSEASGVISSPPISAGYNKVVFPYYLEGGADNYVVLLTSINAGYVYVSNRDEEDGSFKGFSFVAEEEGSVMYLVAHVGIRAKL